MPANTPPQRIVLPGTRRPILINEEFSGLLQEMTDDELSAHIEAQEDAARRAADPFRPDLLDSPAATRLFGLLWPTALLASATLFLLVASMALGIRP